MAIILWHFIICCASMQYKGVETYKTSPGNYLKLHVYYPMLAYSPRYSILVTYSYCIYAFTLAEINSLNDNQ